MGNVFFPGVGPAPLEKVIWVPFLNNSGETVPANGILRITGFDPSDPETSKFTVAKPNTFGAQYSHAINDMAPVPAGEIGQCALGAMVPALYDSGDGTPAFGEIWGPRSGGWKLRKNTGGFLVVGVANQASDLVLVVPQPFTRFRGVTAEAIAQDAVGDVDVYRRSGATSYASTGGTLEALNDLDVDIDAAGAVCEVVFDGLDTDGTPFWRIVNTDFVCPE